MLRPHLSCQTCMALSGFLTSDKGGKMHCGWHRYADRLMLQVSLPLETCLRKSKKCTEDQELIFEQCTWRAEGLTQAYEVAQWFDFAGQGIQTSTRKRAQTEGHLCVMHDFTARNWIVTGNFQKSRQNKKLSVKRGPRGCYHVMKITLGNNGC